MHTEFNMKIEFHVKTWDDRKVFIRAIRDAMQLLYTQAAMISEDAPSMSFTVEDERHGTRTLKVFNKV